MYMQTLIVKAAGQNDSRGVWKIRFHPTVKAISRQHEEVPFGEHDRWFKRKYAPESGNFCFVLKDGATVAGYCRLDRGNDEMYDLSIALAPHYRGEGWGEFLLRQALSRASIKNVAAAVFKNNPTSLRLLQKNGFVIAGEDAEMYYLQKR